jgi:hypothetical protein
VKSAILISTPLVAAIAWIVALIVDPGDFVPASVLLIGLGLLSMATVAVVGIALSGGQWARRLALAVVVANSLVALNRPIDAIWFVAMALTAVSLLAMYLPTVTARIRKLPAASGPPPRSVLTPILLLTVPFSVGLTAVEGESWAMMSVGVTALLAAFLYARVISGGLLAVRIVWPAIALGTAPFLGVVAGTVSALLGIAVSAIAWHPSVRVAFHPPTEAGSTYPIPPELAPREVLDAAQVDDHGKPQ